MEHGNSTEVTEFMLLGLSQTREVQLFLLGLFLLIYSLILLANVLIILTIHKDPCLGSPMYFFLANLAFLDICYCSVTPTRMLADFFCRKAVSYRACLAQLFFLHFLGGAEIFLHFGIASDMYVAICKPLHYATMVDTGVCWALEVAAWAGGFMHSIIQVALLVPLPFCGPNKLDNSYCDITQLVKLACPDTYILEFIMLFNNDLATFMCFLFLLISYGALLVRLRASSSHGKSKAASTCVTHIIVVFVMFSPAIYVYCWPFHSFPMDKVVAVFHTVVFPFMNPMVYALRNRFIDISVQESMEKTNHTSVKEVIFLGFGSPQKTKILLFMFFLSIYMLSLMGNFLIIGIVLMDPLLQAPMYILLGNLSFLKIWYTSVTVPKLLANFLSRSITITVSGCVTQYYYFFSLGATECFLLAVMAYDRYLAICNSLCYATIMSPKFCFENPKQKITTAQ
ncbi:olfactory receptor 4N2-like [Alligator mississippiensis]|uniref:olfactory receptor 4N2-like n=1 Tax=Alligator mississippiensis TaxID=8496 RepID=UPI0028780FF5|nr:olfactory receptor 4N2-like [Alligator mississippiensis]